MAYINLNNPANYQLQDFGQMGFRVIDSTHLNVDGETYRTIYVLEDAVVTALTAKADDITSKALLAGTLLHGLFSDVSVTSGKVLVYMAGRLTASEILALYNAYLIAEGAVIEGSDCVESELNSLTTDTYADASLVLIPSGYDTGVVYGQRPLDARSQIDFTRASTATRVGPNGLIEKGRDNLLLQSNQFDTTWGKIATTEIGGQSGYDGTNDAWRVNLNAGTTLKAVNQNFTAYNGISTASFYAKAGTHSIVQFGTASQNDVFVAFDLSSGSVGSLSAKTINASATSVGNGWYRIQVAYEAIGAAGFVIAAVDSLSATRFSSTSSTGDFYIQDAQLEQSLVATDYIPTTTSARSTFAGITVDGTSVLNVPRLDYSGGASCPSLLLEPSRQNYCTFTEYNPSSGFTIGSNLTWNGFVESPEGINNASRFTSSAPTAAFIQTTVTIPAGDFTFSMYVRGITGPFIKTNLYIPAFAGSISMNENMVEGEGWKRVYGTGNNSGSAITRTVTLPFYDQPAGSVFEVYGFQLESGSYSTSLIPTYGTSATRTADECSKTGISSLIGQTEGVIFIDATLSDVIDTSNIRGLIELNDGTTNNRFSIYRGANSTDITALIFTIAVQKSATVSALSGRVKIAIAYDSNGSSFYFNGTLAGTEAAITYPACSELDLGIITSNTNRVLGDGINQALLFKTRLSNEELASLTTL